MHRGGIGVRLRSFDSRSMLVETNYFIQLHAVQAFFSLRATSTTRQLRFRLPHMSSEPSDRNFGLIKPHNRPHMRDVYRRLRFLSRHRQRTNRDLHYELMPATPSYPLI